MNTTSSSIRPVIPTLRRVLVLLHMATAFGWLALSSAVLLLSVHGLGVADQAARRAVFTVAAHLDDELLADFSFMTVYSGLMLAGLTPWGYTRFWWVTVKLVLALACALGGRALLGRWLAEASTSGGPVPGEALIWGSALLMTAIGFLAWVARAKPWGPIGKGREPARPRAHPTFFWVVVILTPVADYVTGLPLQAVPAAIVLGHHAGHAARNRRRRVLP